MAHTHDENDDRRGRAGDGIDSRRQLLATVGGLLHCEKTERVTPKGGQKNHRNGEEPPGGRKRTTTRIIYKEEKRVGPPLTRRRRVCQGGGRR